MKERIGKLLTKIRNFDSVKDNKNTQRKHLQNISAKEDVLMENNHIKKCSVSFFIRKLKI